ncbi:hypothetical protein [Escherichia phage KW1E_UTAR]|nr:hypothetical protein [Escherichia phage KW1E_UTAR]
MSAIFSLVPNKTFDHTINIPRAGYDDAKLKMTFNHHSLRDLKAEQKTFAEAYEKVSKIKDEEKRDDEGRKLQVKFLQWLASGWEVADEFNEANILTMLENYPRSFDAITTQYQAELWCIRSKG